MSTIRVRLLACACEGLEPQRDAAPNRDLQGWTKGTITPLERPKQPVDDPETAGLSEGNYSMAGMRGARVEEQAVSR